MTSCWIPFSSGFAAWPELFVCDVCGALAVDDALEAAGLPWALGAPLAAGALDDAAAREAEAREVRRLVFLVAAVDTLLMLLRVTAALACRLCDRTAPEHCPSPL